MATKYAVFVTIEGAIDSEALYKRLRCYEMNVTNLVTRTYVYGTLDMTEPIIEYVLQVCYEYGPIKVDIKPVAK